MQEGIWKEYFTYPLDIFHMLRLSSVEVIQKKIIQKCLDECSKAGGHTSLLAVQPTGKTKLSIGSLSVCSQLNPAHSCRHVLLKRRRVVRSS